MFHAIPQRQAQHRKATPISPRGFG